VGAPPMGIGQGTTIECAIVDKNARIGDSVRISPEGKPQNFDGPNFHVRDGIVVVPKNSVIPSGSEI
jgi:glucose-1-phosphate adenylyltransferase